MATECMDVDCEIAIFNHFKWFFFPKVILASMSMNKFKEKTNICNEIVYACMYMWHASQIQRNWVNVVSQFISESYQLQILMYGL